MTLTGLMLACASQATLALEEPKQDVHLFESQFKLDKQGRPDLTHLSQCQPDKSLNTFSEVEENSLPFNSRHYSFQSAPIISSQITHIKGNVKAQDTRSMIFADDVIIDHQKQLLTATGGVSIESDKAYFRADSLTQNENSETTLENAYFYLFTNNANGTAKSVSVNSLNQTKLNELTFSTCPKGSDSWQLSTSEMSIDQTEGRGEAWHTILKVKGVPVFYFPYINFPTDERRKSGLLSPSISNDDKNGLDIRLPVYWNIAPSMDATFSFGNIEKRGVLLGSDFRMLTENSFSEWQFDWMKKDKIVEQILQNSH